MHEVNHDLLAQWPLPAPGGSKYSRGQIVVVGGAASSPGAAVLAGRAALRVGAGRLSMSVAASVAASVAVTFPECGVIPLPASTSRRASAKAVRGAADELRAADAVLFGSGLDHPGETLGMLLVLPALVGEETVVVLDAFALGVATRARRPLRALRGRLILTPNQHEAELLLGRPFNDTEEDLAAIAERFGAVVSCGGRIVNDDGHVWDAGGSVNGLGTSGSGDVLAGAIAGVAARGAHPAQAAVWGTWLHTRAGQLLAERVGDLGYLAGEIGDTLHHALAET